MYLGVPWRALVFLGVPWCALVFLGVPWRALVFLGVPWCSLVCLSVTWCALVCLSCSKSSVEIKISFPCWESNSNSSDAQRVAYSHYTEYASPTHPCDMTETNEMGIFGSLKANLHIPCRAHAVPRPCRVAKDLDCVVPIHLHNASMSDSHMLCRTHAVPH